MWIYKRKYKYINRNDFAKFLENYKRFSITMSQKLYPGQLKFRLQDENTRLEKQRAATRMRMARLRQHQSMNQIVKTSPKLSQKKSNEYVIAQQGLSTKQVANWREKQKQQQKQMDQVAEQLMSQTIIEKYYHFLINFTNK